MQQTALKNTFQVGQTQQSELINYYVQTNYIQLRISSEVREERRDI